MSEYLLGNRVGVGGGGGGDGNISRYVQLYAGQNVSFTIDKPAYDMTILWVIDAHGETTPQLLANQVLSASDGTITEVTSAWTEMVRFNGLPVTWYRQYTITAPAGTVVTWMNPDAARGTCAVLIP